MIIEVHEEFNFENPKRKIIDLNIDENLSIGTLINEIHEIANIPKSTPLEWDGTINYFPYRYYFQNGDEFNDLEKIDNFEEKISSFPKKGKEGELILFFDGSVGLVN
jgi:hypothetical protein